LSCLSFSLGSDPLDNVQMERVCENTVAVDFKQTKLNNFVPFIRSGEWSDIGGRDYMEDAHVCISDLAKNFGYDSVDDEVISFYGVITCSLLTIQFTPLSNEIMSLASSEAIYLCCKF
jgi:hypothetical protein